MKRDALLGNLIARFQALHILKPASAKAKFSKSLLIRSNLLYSFWKYNQSDKCFVWCCHRSLRKERTNDISWTVVWLHVNQVLILKQLRLKLSSSRNSWQVMLRIFNHPEKVFETAWHPQLQINLGHYKCKAMDFLAFLIWYFLVFLAGVNLGWYRK